MTQSRNESPGERGEPEMISCLTGRYSVYLTPRAFKVEYLSFAKISGLRAGIPQCTSNRFLKDVRIITGEVDLGFC